MSALAWTIAALTVACIIVRPRGINAAWWAALGAVLLVAVRAIEPGAALVALRRGTDVYLFLIGMIALAEFARTDGLFGWVANRIATVAGTSRLRLFALVYGAGIVTTALFSNDATIVVLTPAVIATLKRYDTSPVPYVVACALVANAASFILPISNPSNLLVFSGRMPPIGAWLAAFALPSVVAIAFTMAGTIFWFRAQLRDEAAVAGAPDDTHPSIAGIVLLTLAGATVIATSALAGPLGVATFACATIAWLYVVATNGKTSFRTIAESAAPVVILTAALFVIVGVVAVAGAYAGTQAAIEWCARLPWPAATLAPGFLVAIGSNIVTNLPVGLDLGQTLPAMHAGVAVTNAALAGVNLGPNMSINGSLATILWLAILKRENIAMTGRRFFVVGTIITIPALAATLIAIHP